MMMQPQPPSAQAGEDYNRMAARIPSMSDEQLQTFINTGFGALALTEISRRNRLKQMQAAQQAAETEPTGTMADAEIQKMMQSKMTDRLASDDRMGLNNIIAQAEQGDLEFGQPTESTRSMSGGGIVAFADGRYPVRPLLSDDERLAIMNKATEMKLNNPERILQEIESSPENVAKYREAFSKSSRQPKVREDRSRFAKTFGFEPGALFDIQNVPGAVSRTVGSALDFFSRKTPIQQKQAEMEKQLSELENKEAALALKGLDLDPESKIALKGLRTTLGKDTGPKKTIDTSRFFPKEEVEKEKARAAEAAKPKKPAKKDTGIKSIPTDAESIYNARKALMEKAGLGAFGADVEKMLGESEEKTKKGLEGLKLVKAATTGAKAVGGRGRNRKSGLEALASAVSGAAEGAGSVAEKEMEVQSKFDEFRIRNAQAKDAYERGEVGKADELSRAAQKAEKEYALKSRELDILEKYKDQVSQAAILKASKQYGVKPGDVVNATKTARELREELSNIDPENPANAARIAEIKQDIQMMKALAGMGTLGSLGLQIQDVPDEE